MTIRLLLDHNLSVRLTTRLDDIFHGVNHVSLVGLSRASDLEVWRFALENNYAIVTKDSDFNDLSILYSVPPKVIWLRIGNTTLAECERFMRYHYLAIVAFLALPDAPLMSISRP